VVLVDTNVLLRHLLGDDEDQSPRASAFWRRVEQGEIPARLSDLALFETVFTLQREARVPRPEIRDRLQRLLDMPGLTVPDADTWRDALDLYARGRLSYADAYHVILAASLEISEIVSFDTDLDRVPSVTRIEP
jgi:predicted nucleic acid-binding protein